MTTHDLMGGVASRICDELVACVFVEKVENGDGSASTSRVPVSLMASVTPLQPKDLERLQMQGLKVQDGVTIVLPFGTAEPDTIERENGDAYRVVNFSDVAGATVCTCDKIVLGAALPVEVENV